MKLSKDEQRGRYAMTREQLQCKHNHAFMDTLESKHIKSQLTMAFKIISNLVNTTYSGPVLHSRPLKYH